MAYATKAFLCMAMARLAYEEGMCLDVSTGGELHVARSAGVPPDRLVLHGNNKSDEELADRRSPSASAGSSSTPSTRSTVSSGCCHGTVDRHRTAQASGPERPPQVLARITPGVEVHTHEFVRTGQDDSKFGFGLASGAAGRAVERLVELDDAGAVEFVGIHAHLGSQVFALAPFAQAIEVLAGFFAPLGLPELVVGGGLGVRLRERGGGPAHGRVGRTRSARPAARPGIPDSVRVTAEPGRSIVAPAGDHPLPGGHGQGGAGPSDLRLGGRRDERQPAPRALRQRLRGVPAPGDGRGTPRAGPGGGQALRDRRRRRVGRLRARATSVSGTSWPRR